MRPSRVSVGSTSQPSVFETMYPEYNSDQLLTQIIGNINRTNAMILRSRHNHTDNIKHYIGIAFDMLVDYILRIQKPNNKLIFTEPPVPESIPALHIILNDDNPSQYLIRYNNNRDDLDGILENAITTLENSRTESVSRKIQAAFSSLYILLNFSIASEYTFDLIEEIRINEHVFPSNSAYGKKKKRLTRKRKASRKNKTSRKRKTSSKNSKKTSLRRKK